MWPVQYQLCLDTKCTTNESKYNIRYVLLVVYMCHTYEPTNQPEKMGQCNAVLGQSILKGQLGHSFVTKVSVTKNHHFLKLCQEGQLGPPR